MWCIWSSNTSLICFSIYWMKQNCEIVFMDQRLVFHKMEMPSGKKYLRDIELSYEHDNFKINFQNANWKYQWKKTSWKITLKTSNIRAPQQAIKLLVTQMQLEQYLNLQSHEQMALMMWVKVKHLHTWNTFSSHIEAEIKWPPFRRRHFQTHFLDWKC